MNDIYGCTELYPISEEEANKYYSKVEKEIKDLEHRLSVPYMTELEKSQSIVRLTRKEKKAIKINIIS